jgi:hypothetical protein
MRLPRLIRRTQHHVDAEPVDVAAMLAAYADTNPPNGALASADSAPTGGLLAEARRRAAAATAARQPSPPHW